MKTFTKSLIAAALMVFTLSANAEYTTETQTESFSGKAGASSAESGVSPLVFNYFDSALGKLTGIHIQYSFLTEGGLVGAENLTNQQVSGNVELGSTMYLDFSSLVDFLSLTPLTSKQGSSFTLEPNDSVSNSGSDYYSLTGTSNSVSSTLTTLDNEYFKNAFIGNDGETFDLGFSTTSITNVSTEGGVQGFFQAVDTMLDVSIYYSYEDYPEEPVEEPVENSTDVPAPIAGVFGLAMLGLALYRKKEEKTA